MTDDRLQQLMQDALDETLSPEQQQELSESLAQDQVAAEEFQAQQQVDDLLTRPPMERAPQRLAMTIMARIGEMAIEQQQQRGEFDALMQASLTVALQLVTVATMPLLVGASWMLVNAMADEDLMDEVFTQIVGLLRLTLDTMSVIVEEAEKLSKEDPEAAMVMLSLMPVTMLELVKNILDVDEEDIDT